MTISLELDIDSSFVADPPEPSPRPETTELTNAELADIAHQQMLHMSAEVNESLGQKIVGPDGRIKMFMYGEVLGNDQVRQDTGYVRSKKVEWAKLYDQDTKNNDIARFDLAEKAARSTDDQLMDAILRERDKEEAKRGGNLAEVAATLLLHRALGEQFVVVRTAAYDDIKNGIDTVVINKETGEVICAFDEVMAGKNSEIVATKRQRQEEAIAKGGVDLRYGLTFKDGTVVKQSFANVPVFRLRLDSADVRVALTECANTEGLGSEGERILLSLLDSLGAQTNSYLKNTNIKPAMRQKLEQYRDGSLREMKKLSAMKKSAS